MYGYNKLPLRFAHYSLLFITVTSHDKVLRIKQCMDELTKIVEEKEQLSDKDFDGFNIMLGSGESSKDDLVVYRRSSYCSIRCTIPPLHSESIISRIPCRLSATEQFGIPFFAQDLQPFHTGQMAPAFSD